MHSFKLLIEVEYVAHPTKGGSVFRVRLELLVS